MPEKVRIRIFFGHIFISELLESSKLLIEIAYKSDADDFKVIFGFACEIANQINKSEQERTGYSSASAIGENMPTGITITNRLWWDQN